VSWRRTLGRLALVAGSCGGLVSATPLLAQPAAEGAPFDLSDGPVDSELAPVIALGGQGNGVAVWTRPGNVSSVEGRDVVARRMSAEGGVQGPAITVNETTLGDQDAPAAAMTGDGGFLILWRSHTVIAGAQITTYFVRAFAASGTPRGPETAVGEGSPYEERGAVACSPLGDCWVAWFGEGTILLRRIGQDGRLLGPARTAAMVGFNELNGRNPALAADANGASVVWTQSGLLLLRRFANDGSPPPAPVVLAAHDYSIFPAAAFAPDGSLGVAWVLESNSDSEVRVRRFRADGTPLGEERSGLAGPRASGGSLGPLALAATAEGGFLVTLSRPAGLLYIGPDGRPRGSALPAGDVVNGERHSFGLQAAGAPDGSFLAAWIYGGVRVQRFVLPPPGDEPCWFGENGTLRCDSLHDGGEAELETKLDLQPGGTPLLGDLDGNGQDDLCVQRAGLLFCDLSHRGDGYDSALAFGVPDDTMLLGDVNGDGRDDPCVRHGRRFLCDTAHDGGAAELKIAFGSAGDRPLLGDLAGDGAADPCVVRGRRLLCDLAHDGGAAELSSTLDFVEPGDPVFLADADGDGRDDFCAERGGRFLCDTAHDGGAAEWSRDFVAPGSVALFGNVDGF